MSTRKTRPVWSQGFLEGRVSPRIVEVDMTDDQRRSGCDRICADVRRAVEEDREGNVSAFSPWYYKVQQ